MVDKKIIYIAIGILVLVVAIYFFLPGSQESQEETLVEREVQSELAGVWINQELKDVTTGEVFKVSDFNKHVLLESFAVWCPTCTRQQQEIKKLHEDPEIGESVISISLDTDPNEDEARVREHIERNGFNWRYAVSPTDFTQALIDQFGIGIVNAPSAPVVLICEGGKARKLDSGVKDVNELKQELEKGC